MHHLLLEHMIIYSHDMIKKLWRQAFLQTKYAWFWQDCLADEKVRVETLKATGKQQKLPPKIIGGRGDLFVFVGIQLAGDLLKFLLAGKR